MPSLPPFFCFIPPSNTPSIRSSSSPILRSSVPRPMHSPSQSPPPHNRPSSSIPNSFPPDSVHSESNVESINPSTNPHAHLNVLLPPSSLPPSNTPDPIQLRFRFIPYQHSRARPQRPKHSNDVLLGPSHFVTLLIGLLISIHRVIRCITGTINIHLGLLIPFTWGKICHFGGVKSRGVCTI
jgi:hypothetical protein